MYLGFGIFVGHCKKETAIPQALNQLIRWNHSHLLDHLAVHPKLKTRFTRRSLLSVCVCVLSIVSHVSLCHFVVKTKDFLAKTKEVLPFLHLCQKSFIFATLFAMFTLHTNEGSTHTEHVQTYYIVNNPLY